MHITITGRLGSGKSSVASYLSQQYGFEIYSTGAVQRDMARRMGLTTLEMNEKMKGDVNFDHMIDDAVTRLSEERAGDRLLFDSRMAWHFAKHSFRVFITIDPQIAGNRCVLSRHSSDENYESAEQARDELLLRSKIENLRFKDIYHVDNLDYRNYDLIIDSSVANQQQIGDLIFREYEAYAASPETYEPKIFLAAQSVYPGVRPEDAVASDSVLIFHRAGYHYAVSPYEPVLKGIGEKEPFLRCTLVDEPENAGHVLSGIGEHTLRTLEKENGFCYSTIPQEYKSTILEAL